MKESKTELLLKAQWITGIIQHLSQQLAMYRQKDQKDYKVMTTVNKLTNDIKEAQKVHTEIFTKTLVIFQEDHNLHLRSYKHLTDVESTEKAGS